MFTRVLNAFALLLLGTRAAETAESAEAIDASNLDFLTTGDANLEAAPSLTGDPNQALQQIYQTYQQAVQAALPSRNGCSASNIIVRKEWNNLTPAEMQNWFDAMNCMNRLPSQTDPSIAPGARSRYDDFTAAHIMRTTEVHFSPWLCLFHRHYIWLFEQAMRNECGYTGGMPFGDWLKYNPMSSGLMADLGGDGVQTSESNCTCVQQGPFANWQVNLGPTGTGNPCSPNPQEDGLGYNPRCLERKFDMARLADLSPLNVASTIVDSPDINTFGPRLDTGPALHANPHGFVGGLQGGIPASSHDPWFMTHHPCLDRMYTMWVSQDVSNRLGAIADASVYASLRREGWGDAPTVTLDSTVFVSPVFQNVTVRDIVSTTDGLYCYMYE